MSKAPKTTESETALGTGPATIEHGDPAHPNHPGVLDQAAAQAEAETHGEVVKVTAHDPETGEIEETSSGVRVRRAFTMKMFLPDDNWIAQNVVAGGKGTHRIVGRVFGAVIGAEERTNTIVKGGKSETVRSIALKGTFEAQSALDGATETFSLLFLPMAFAEQAAAALSINEGESLKMDVDIGLEATGKTIPYEWTVHTYYRGKAERAMRSMRDARRPGQPPAIGSPQARLKLA